MEDSYYARFGIRSYHCFREIYLKARLDVNVDRRADGNSNSCVAPSYKQVRNKSFVQNVFKANDLALQ